MEPLLPFVTADQKKCIGCRVCEIACHSYHHVVGKTIGTVIDPIVPKLYPQRENSQKVLVQCHQCEGAPCAQVCALKAICVHHRRIMVDRIRCDGCGDCIKACPFGAIRLALFKQDESMVELGGSATRLVPNKCDLCLGREQGPVCVEECPAQALCLVHPLKDKRTKNRMTVENSKYLIRK